MNLFLIVEKILKDSGRNISVKYLSKMWWLWTKNMHGMTDKVKVEILYRSQADHALQKTSIQLFWSCTLFMVQIYPIFSILYN